MTATEIPTVPSDVAGRLQRYMTIAGYNLALTNFGAQGVLDAVAMNTDLRLAAAELLEGLPSTSGTTEGGTNDLKRFKLDVLEFEYQTNKTSITTDWGAIAKRLRTQFAEASGYGGGMFTPIVDAWGVEGDPA